MAEFYNTSYLDDPVMRAYLAQRHATSGQVVSPSVLDRILQAKLSAAAEDAARRKAIAYQNFRNMLSIKQKEDDLKATQEGKVAQGLGHLGTAILATYGRPYLRRPVAEALGEESV
jgi:hypothetical protein